MNGLYDPTGGHDAHLADAQERMQRIVAHIEDETGQPFELDSNEPKTDKREAP